MKYPNVCLSHSAGSRVFLQVQLVVKCKVKMYLIKRLIFISAKHLKFNRFLKVSEIICKAMALHLIPKSAGSDSKQM